MIKIIKERPDKLIIKQTLVEYYIMAGFAFLFSVIFIFFEQMDSPNNLELSNFLFPGLLLIS